MMVRFVAVLALIGVAAAWVLPGFARSHSDNAMGSFESAVDERNFLKMFEDEKRVVDTAEPSTKFAANLPAFENAQAARGVKNGRTKKSKKKGVGLYMGTQFETAKRRKVLMQDGSAFREMDMSLRPVDCGEKITGWGVKGFSKKVLSQQDISVSWSRIDGSFQAGNHGCVQHTYNITAEVRFNGFPGKTDVKLMIYTNKQGKKRMYPFKASFLAVGVVLYEKTSKKGVKIRSGDGHKAKNLGNFKKIRKTKNQTYHLNVEVQGPVGNGMPNRNSVDIRVYDPNCDGFPNIINYDSSCPAAYVTKKGLKKPRKRSNNFRNEGYRCNASFSKDMKHFFFKLNKNRVGCGRLCFEMRWPALKLGGNVFTTSFCFNIDTTPKPPAVVNCASMEPDYYGGDQFSFDAFNLDSIQDNELQNSVPATFRIGGASWDVTYIRMGAAEQQVTVRASSFEKTTARNLTMSANRAVFVYERDDGSQFEVKSRVQCGRSGYNGEMRVAYQPPILAEPQPIQRTQTHEQIVEVQIFTPDVEKMTTSRVAKYIAALPVEGGIFVGVKSLGDDAAAPCESFLCSMQRFMQNTIHGASARAESPLGNELKIHVALDATDAFEVMDRIAAAADSFNDAVGGFGVQITHVGEPIEQFVTFGSK